MKTTVLDKMLNKRMVKVENLDDNEIKFTDEDGVIYRLYHSQDCCECVYIESVIGDLNDLLGVPLWVAEEVAFDGQEVPEGVTKKERDEENEYEDESFTWTFYKFATVKGYVDIRFYGSSNGYYSESAELEIENPNAEEEED